MVGQNLGQYRLLERVASGGMATVFHAIDETLDREVALKIVDASLDDPARRFRTEATTIARLTHPGIATVYELFQHESHWVMVMEFVRGESLDELASRLGTVAPEHAADLCIQALTALAYSHRMGVIHRDLKPSNLMVTTAGTVKIMDFGIARVLGSEHLTHAGFTMGTPAYMAPEQVKGETIDARADLYAIGMIFYRLITGRLPFDGTTPFAMAQSQVNEVPPPVRLLNPSLPDWTDGIVARALAKAPDDRFQSADEFRCALKPLLDRSRIPAVGGGDDRTERLEIASAIPAKRSKALMPSLAVAALVLAVVGTRAWWTSFVGTRSTPVPIEQARLTASPLPLPPYGLLVPRRRVRLVVETATNEPALEAKSDDAVAAATAQPTHAAFSKVKLLTVDGGRTTTRDIVLNLSDDQMTVLPNDGGAPIAVVPYRQLAKATYVHARDPRWDASLGAPPANISGSGILARARHWLVVQTKDSCAILQLDGDQWATILQTFEVRTRLTIERPSEKSSESAQRGANAAARNQTASAGRPK